MLINILHFPVIVKAEDDSGMREIDFDTEYTIKLDNRGTAILQLETYDVTDMNIIIKADHELTIAGRYTGGASLTGSLLKENNGPKVLPEQNDAFELTDTYINDGQLYEYYQLVLQSNADSNNITLKVTKGEQSPVVLPEIKSMKAYGNTDITFYYHYYYPSTTLSVVYDPYLPAETTMWEYGEEAQNHIMVYGAFPQPHYEFLQPGGPFKITARNYSNKDLFVDFNVTIVDEDPPVGTYTTTVSILDGGVWKDIDKEYTLEKGKKYSLRIEYFSKVCIPAYNNSSEIPALRDSKLLQSGQLYDRQWTNVKMSDVGLAYTVDVTPVKSGTEQLTFGSDKTVNLKVKNPSFEFSDVTDPTKSYYTPVYWAVDKGITTGKTATTFAPGEPCTRAQFVTFLWRAMGKPEPKTTVSPFTDVQDKTRSYYKAVLWALENKITTGTSATTFSPSREVTRGQVATFLYRAAGKPAVTGTNPFADVEEGRSYTEPIIWMVEKKITTGTSETTFSPQRSCTRAQTVTFLYRTYKDQ